MSRVLHVILDGRAARVNGEDVFDSACRDAGHMQVTARARALVVFHEK
jgi:hypothetical protein